MCADLLKLEECFVLCDAGGGTVDVVSYRVTQLEPTLELEQVASPYSKFELRKPGVVVSLLTLAGAKCGSAYIDANFKQWLCDTLGEKHFKALDPKSNGKKISRTSESSNMRIVIKAFDGYKKSFKGNSAAVKIDLPAPIDKINVAGKVNQGELTITEYEVSTPKCKAVQLILLVARK